MWTPKKYTTKRTTMDFSSSGQQKVEVTTVYADDEKIANAAELMDFEEDPVQFEVCDHCGFPGCAPGGRLSIRKLGEFTLMIPAFSAMDEESGEASEYCPPYFTRTKGSILLAQDHYRDLVSLLPKLPRTESVRAISSYEFARLLQWEAPFRVFGGYPEPIDFRRELLCTTSAADDADAVRRLLEIMRRFERDDIRPKLMPINEADEKISFFLDASNFIEWKPLVRKAGGRYGLVLNDGYCVIDGQQK